MGVKKHKKNSPETVKIGVITMSSSRTIEDDSSGSWMVKRSKKEGHEVCCHLVVPDNEEEIRKAIRDSVRDHEPDVLLLTGGTGITKADVTIEAIVPMFRKELSSFAPVFAQLSHEQVDSAAIISRSIAGLIGDTVVFSLPGSLKACKLACKALIFPEVGHIVKHMRE